VKKWIRTLTLASVFATSAVGVVSLSSPTTAQAQTAKDKKAADNKAEKPATKAEEKKPAAAAVKGEVIIKPDAKGRYRISIKNDDKTVLMSAGNGFETEKEARDAIEEIKSILASTRVTVEKAEASKDK
jgi:uncharacterized protein YegP (UPF0339 family)